MIILVSAKNICDFWDFYFLGQPIYWTYKQPLCCYKMTE